MTPLRSYDIIINEPCQAYELVGGVFAKAMPNPEKNLEPDHRNTNYHIRRMRFINLPTAEHPPDTWEIEDVGFDIRDFAIDPGQDLLVLLQHETSTHGHPYFLQGIHIHFRTMSENVGHPLAAHRDVFCHAPHFLSGAEIQIADDVVSVQTRQKLLIWNWKTGILLVVNYQSSCS